MSDETVIDLNTIDDGEELLALLKSQGHTPPSHVARGVVALVTRAEELLAAAQSLNLQWKRYGLAAAVSDAAMMRDARNESKWAFTYLKKLTRGEP